MGLSITLVRGLPGSGKTTYAKKLCQSFPGTQHFEADHFFYDAQGHYVFDASKLTQAHQWCEQQSKRALLENQSIVVANTFVCLWEMEAYQNLAKQLNANVYYVECKNQFGSLHQVPQSTIAKMRQNWQSLPPSLASQSSFYKLDTDAYD